MGCAVCLTYVFVRLLCWDVFVYQKGTGKLVWAGRSGVYSALWSFIRCKFECFLPILNVDTDILLLAMPVFYAVCHSGNLCCGSAPATQEREVIHPVGISWAAQARRTLICWEQWVHHSTGCNSRMELPAVLAARELSRQRSPKVAMFHWLTCLSDCSEDVRMVGWRWAC